MAHALCRASLNGARNGGFATAELGGLDGSAGDVGPILLGLRKQGGQRASGNVGYQFSPDFETRFYINANDIRQRIPGSVTRASALSSPETAAAGNVINDQQRNIDGGLAAGLSCVTFDVTQPLLSCAMARAALAL